MTSRRRNVHRDNRRLDGVIAVVCLLAALFVAALIATDEQPLTDNNSVYSEDVTK